ncbi:hypothetical protein BDW59DRAFT_2589 [Aspergillus cavernicola]|uniref:BTB domain transcription factor n=1 Tax=Aspergillus cavernicola TaxID=176166 RepID=A0ABR4J4S7_9EURO
MATRTSTRHAAQKAKEAMAAAPDTKRRGSVGTKRKGSTEKAPEPKREKKKNEKPERAQEEPQPVPEEKVEAGEKQVTLPEDKPEDKPEAEHDEQPQVKSDEAEEKSEEKPSTASVDGTEAGMKKHHEREEIVPSNILEKGMIYFFYRGRVNVQEAHSIQDVARSFFVLRPTPLGAALDHEQGEMDTGAKCRLLMLPKKKYPISGKDREMGFVEKSGTSIKQLQESFIAGGSYETSTRGIREAPEAKPYAEGVYAITSTKRATHLVYHITLPEKPGEIQGDFGLGERGSWLLQSKNPKFPGPPNARLPKEPEFPKRSVVTPALNVRIMTSHDSIQEKFRGLRWIPTEPELLDYPNAQVLMVGSAVGDLGKAATAEQGDKRPEEEQPEEELIKMEDENEERIEALGGDHAIYKDLGYHAQEKYSKLVTTWDASQE